MKKATFTALILLALLAGCVVMNPAAPVAPVAPMVAEPTAALEPAALGMGSRAVGTFSEDGYFEHSLTVADDITVGDDAAVGGNMTVTGAITGGTLACTSASWPTNVVITGTVDIDGATTITGTLTSLGAIAQTQVNAAGGSANPYDYTGSLGIMNGSDDFTLFDANITNADHTGSNTIQVLDVANITGDAQATETAIKVGTGWDSGLTLGSPAALNAGITVDSTAFSVTDSTGAVATASSIAVGTWLKLGSQVAVAVTAGSTITPTGTMQPLTSGSAVTTSTSEAIANGTTAGDVLILRNANASDTITIDGTGGNVECKTDKVLGAQDTLTLVWNGSDWVCLSISDNS